MFKRTLHLNLIVSDFDRSHQFYTKVLGFEEIMQFKIGGPGFQKGVGIDNSGARVAHVQMPGGGFILEISEYYKGKSTVKTGERKANEPGFRHVALRVDDIDAAYGSLRAKKVRFISEPVTVSQPESLKGFKFCYFFDPDGNIWELNQAPENA